MEPSVLVCFPSHPLSRSMCAFTCCCNVCNFPLCNMCDAGSKYEPNDVAGLFRYESHHIACTRICWNVKFTNGSHTDGIFFSGRKSAAPGTIKELALLYIAPAVERCVLPAPVDMKADVGETSFSCTSVTSASDLNSAILQKPSTRQTSSIFWSPPRQQVLLV